jgi:hypothetical protein
MWSDNETATDLLGFKVHADLIKSVVTDAGLLPVVLGVFGAWGGGKSSIMRMLENDLNSDEYEDVACLYFNGWMFEGYEDAKTALLSSILVQLGEHERFGPKVKERVVGLLKRVKWMELAKLGVKHIGVPLAVGAMTGGIGALPAAAAMLLDSARSGGAAKPDKKEAGIDDKEISWADLIKEDPGKPDLLEIRKFRDEFEEMLKATDIKSLVILIDDLDRCLPERIIETLEAIKLFVAVPRTAFVIGADPRIVRHAIATRYVHRQIGDDNTTLREEYNLVEDYLEKLIQIPYHLPRLSPAEIETYINLLACQKHLNSEQCSTVLKHWSAKRGANFYAAYQQGAIREALGGERPIMSELERQLSWSNAVAQVITEGLKGNPRQVKRMLNAMLLRRQLAKVAGIEIRDEVLAKLMVLEYAHWPRFQELNDWQAGENGRPEKVKILEEWALADGAGAKAKLDESLGEWDKPSLRSWLRMQPELGEVDLRDYFWLARDKTSSTLAGVQMVSPLVNRLFRQLVGDNEGEQHVGAREAGTLDEAEREALLRLLHEQVERHPDQIAGPAALTLLVERKVQGAAQTLFAALKNANAASLDPGVAFRLQALGKGDPNLADSTRQALEHLRNKKETRVGKAAEKALKG